MLASLNFIRSSLHNDSARIYRRETFLTETTMKQGGRLCAGCGRNIPPRAKFALSLSLTCLCGLCYGDMPDCAAEARVRFETTTCVTVTLHRYREVSLYDFGQALVIICPDGGSLKFKNMARAKAWVDAACDGTQTL